MSAHSSPRSWALQKNSHGASGPEVVSNPDFAKGWARAPAGPTYLSLEPHATKKTRLS